MESTGQTRQGNEQEAAARPKFHNPYVPQRAPGNPQPPGALARAQGDGLPLRTDTFGGELWRVSRVARYLDVRPKRVYQLIAEGRLPCYRLSVRDTRIPFKAVEAYVHGCLVDPEDMPQWR